MNLNSKKLKLAGTINTILIIIAIIFQIYLMCVVRPIPALEFLSDLLVMVALAFGLFYLFLGYKKNAAKFYKTFMILTFITFVFSAITIAQDFNNAIFNSCVAIARIIPIAILAVKKNFGKNKSKVCAFIIFVLSLLLLVGSIILYISYPINIVLSVSQLLLSVITILFVEAKYADKDARGAE